MFIDVYGSGMLRVLSQGATGDSNHSKPLIRFSRVDFGILPTWTLLFPTSPGLKATNCQQFKNPVPPCSEICAAGRLFQGQQQHPWPALVLKAPGANSMILGDLGPLRAKRLLGYSTSDSHKTQKVQDYLRFAVQTKGNMNIEQGNVQN